MKFAPATEKPKFNPITITLESEEEVAKIHAIFNYTGIIESVGLVNICFGLRRANKEAGNEEINSDTYYEKLFEALRK